MAYKSGAADSPVTSDTYLMVAPGTAGLLRDTWLGVSGTTVSAIPVNSTPTSTAIIEQRPEYAAELRRQLRPARPRLSRRGSTTGSYTFWLCSDDDSELWLSTSSNPASKTRIAGLSSRRPPGYQDWTKAAKSAAISLTAGQKYYIEVLHKESTGTDHCSVGWAKPGQGTTAPSECIPAASLTPTP